MREIKFRAWIYDRTNKRGQYHYAKDFGHSEGKLIAYCEEHCDWSEDFLEQFTGLCDKNGKEIYEGDICINGDWVDDARAWSYREEVVEWQKENAMFTGLNWNKDGMSCEIIGHVHEHGELMK